MTREKTRTPALPLPPMPGQLTSGDATAPAGAFYNREEISHPYNFPPNGEPRNAADEIANAIWEMKRCFRIL